jgi:hypothetical protein
VEPGHEVVKFKGKDSTTSAGKFAETEVLATHKKIAVKVP